MQNISIYLLRVKRTDIIHNIIHIYLQMYVYRKLYIAEKSLRHVTTDGPREEITKRQEAASCKCHA